MHDGEAGTEGDESAALGEDHEETVETLWEIRVLVGLEKLQAEGCR